MHGRHEVNRQQTLVIIHSTAVGQEDDYYIVCKRSLACRFFAQNEVLHSDLKHVVQRRDALSGPGAG